jgi:uncharacterized protein (UPF0276 family)
VGVGVAADVEDAVAADRFGLGWRAQLAAAIFASLDRIDVVEVIAEDWLDVDRRDVSALRTLTRQVHTSVHATSLGMASTIAVDRRRLDRVARLIGRIEPATWSEHLAFVRAGGIEIGHLAAPPRCASTLAGLVRNIERARNVVGSAPHLENVATLLDPPGSTLEEGEWLSAVSSETGSDLLLDLHNLHANARNFAFDAHSVIRALPASRLSSIHLAGGRALPGGRWLDDHLHDVPDAVFMLLETVGEVTAACTHSLDVIIERDGYYPPFESLLAELERARSALARGRMRARARGTPTVFAEMPA